MRDYSLVILVGRLARDPELKYGSNGGLPYAKFALAVNKEVPQQDGSVKKTVSFIEITVWRHQAEIACQFLKKGSTCMVVGQLRQSRWSDKEGQNRSKVEVTADRIQFLDRKIEVPVPVSVTNGSGDEAEQPGEEAAEE
jgi:single-strand DNA-binding protein